MPFLRDGHPRPRRPRRAAGRGRRALPPLRRGLADQRAEPGAAGRDRRPSSPTAGIELPLYWGNRNWHPLLADTVAADARRRRPAGAGARDQRDRLVLGLPAVPREPGRRRRRPSGRGAPELVKLRHYFDHPGFIEANADGVRAALAELPAELRDDAVLVFTAHSIPVSDERDVRPVRRALRSPSSTRRPGWSPRRCAARAPSSSWPGSRGPARRRCPGSSPTSTTSCARWPRAGPRRSSSARPASSPTTSRWPGTSTSRRAQTAAAARAAVRPGRDRRHPSGVRRR